MQEVNVEVILGKYSRRLVVHRQDDYKEMFLDHAIFPWSHVFVKPEPELLYSPCVQ